MSRMIILEGPRGQREVPEGKPYRKLPGEKVMGSRQHVIGLLEQARSSEGLGVGDLIAAGTKLVGIQPCAPCSKRQRRWNQYRIRL